MRVLETVQARGFTLLEVLTTLFIIGLVTAIIGPRLPLMIDRLDYALKRETFEEALGTLAYQAMRDNRDLVLAGDYDETGPVTGTSENENKDADEVVSRRLAQPVLNTAGTLADIAPVAPAKAPLHLPPGWRLSAQQPIYFSANGYCNGGRVELEVGTDTYTYTLRPPFCAASLE